MVARSLSSKQVVNAVRKVLWVSFTSHKPIKVVLLISALLHGIEFLICTFGFEYGATFHFSTPVATRIGGEESLRYAHSIIRQYGFFVVQLALVALWVAREPVQYAPFIRVLALARVLMAALSMSVALEQTLSVWQWLPALMIDVGIASALWILTPKSPSLPTMAEDLKHLEAKKVVGLSITPLVQWRALQLLCLIAGTLWILWGLGSTILWEIGVANISSDQTMEQELLQAMQANHVVRNQQGVMLMSIGIITAMAAKNPLSYRYIIEFAIAQQVINAFSALVELSFGAILLTQFLTVVSVQVITFVLFYGLNALTQSRGEMLPQEVMVEKKVCGEA